MLNIIQVHIWSELDNVLRCVYTAALNSPEQPKEGHRKVVTLLALINTPAFYSEYNT